ncbi:MAG TPA: hypothetical protein VHH88_00840, partial [Verrucomicrobiae bacterium]|nr:hypothetical protein [Verrucomicrobiae bacterium]
WSRGLVAWLYFCQPIVRGWARYHGRLAPRPAPLAAQQTLDSVALRNSDLPLEQLDYWAETRIDRLQFVAAMPRELARQGWAVKSDEGWSDYDLEVYGSRWASLRITTIAEDHPVNRQLFRCRLRPVWSLQAKAGFWGLLAIELLALGISDASWRWLLLLPVSVAAALWLLRREKRTLQSTIAAFLDGFAKQWNLFKISAQPAASPAMKSAEALLSSKPSPFAESASRPQASQPAEAEKKIVQV